MLGVPGAKRLLPEGWRRFPLFDNIHQLTGVPVITVQLRYPGWVTELQDPVKARNLDDVRSSLPLATTATRLSCKVFYGSSRVSPMPLWSETSSSSVTDNLSHNHGPGALSERGALDMGCCKSCATSTTFSIITMIKHLWLF